MAFKYVALIVRAGHDPNAVLVGVVGEPLEIRDDALGAGDIQLAVRVHEVDLRIDVPEYPSKMLTHFRRF